MPISASKLREIAKRNPRSPEEETKALQEAMKSMIRDNRAFVMLSEALTKTAFAVSGASLLQWNPIPPRTFFSNDYILDSIKRMSEAAQRWHELRAKAIADAKVLGIDLDSDELDDWTVEQLTEVANAVRMIRQTKEKAPRLHELAMSAVTRKGQGIKPGPTPLTTEEMDKEMEEEISDWLRSGLTDQEFSDFKRRKSRTILSKHKKRYRVKHGPDSLGKRR